MSISAKSIGSVIRKFAAHHPIAAAYLHGSYACDMPDAESDLDIAILAHRKTTKEERDALKLALSSHLLSVLGESTPEIDLTILQDVPILLQYNVLRRGVLIYEGSRSERMEATMRIEQEYDDASPMLDIECDMILRRILSPAR